MRFQKTLKKTVKISGVGLHSGQQTQLVIRPAHPNLGIIFVRTDLEGSPAVAAHYKNVVSTRLATTIGVGKVKVSTVEHIMAAFAGCGIDNAVVEMDGPEVPVLDGSSVAFCEALQAAGTIEQDVCRQVIRIKKRVELRIGEKWAVVEPSDVTEIHASIEFDHPLVGYQEYKYVEGENSFKDLCASRTFCYLRDVEALQRIGLAQGGSLENAIVLDEASVLNEDGLRTPDEFVRHKVLDSVGDFKLAGVSIQGKFRLHRAGHDLHSQLLAVIFADAENYEVVDLEEEAEIRQSLPLSALAAV